MSTLADETERSADIMYVCICNAINERAVRSALDEGAHNAGAVFARNGCAPQCGKCVPEMRGMIRAHSSSRPAAQTAGLQIAAE